MRTIGIQRAEMKIGFDNHFYNIRRVFDLECIKKSLNPACSTPVVARRSETNRHIAITSRPSNKIIRKYSHNSTLGFVHYLFKTLI